MRQFIYGRNPVLETLRARRRECFRLQVAEGVQVRGHLEDILALAAQRKLVVESVTRAHLDKINANHQGVALETSGYPYAALEDMFELAVKRSDLLFILLLDSLQNPQNLGTLMRTAEAVGVQGILIPAHRSAEVTPAVVSASAGASEHLLVAQVNLAQAIEELREAGAWIVGLDESPEARLPSEIKFNGALGLVVGGEGQGIRPLVKSKCDFLCRLPMHGRIESLNAAVAGSVVLYLAYFERDKEKINNQEERNKTTR